MINKITTSKGRKLILWIVSVAIISISLNVIREKQVYTNYQYEADQKALNTEIEEQQELWDIVELGHKQAIKVAKAKMLAEGWQPPKKERKDK